jgi:hypothetical protein
VLTQWSQQHPEQDHHEDDEQHDDEYPFQSHRPTPQYSSTESIDRRIVGRTAPGRRSRR